MKMSDADRKTLPDYRGAVGSLVRQLKARFEDLEVRYYDPKCFLWLPQVWRYGVRGGDVTWVFEGRVIGRGLPSFESLCEALEKRL